MKLIIQTLILFLCVTSSALPEQNLGNTQDLVLYKRDHFFHNQKKSEYCSPTRLSQIHDFQKQKFHKYEYTQSTGYAEGRWSCDGKWVGGRESLSSPLRLYTTRSLSVKFSTINEGYASETTFGRVEPKTSLSDASQPELASMPENDLPELTSMSPGNSPPPEEINLKPPSSAASRPNASPLLRPFEDASNPEYFLVKPHWQVPLPGDGNCAYHGLSMHPWIKIDKKTTVGIKKSYINWLSYLIAKSEDEQTPEQRALMSAIAATHLQGMREEESYDETLDEMYTNNPKMVVHEFLVEVRKPQVFADMLPFAVFLWEKHQIAVILVDATNKFVLKYPMDAEEKPEREKTIYFKRTGSTMLDWHFNLLILDEDNDLIPNLPNQQPNIDVQEDQKDESEERNEKKKKKKKIEKKERLNKNQLKKKD